MVFPSPPILLCKMFPFCWVSWYTYIYLTYRTKREEQREEEIESEYLQSVLQCWFKHNAGALLFISHIDSAKSLSHRLLYLLTVILTFYYKFALPLSFSRFSSFFPNCCYFSLHKISECFLFDIILRAFGLDCLIEFLIPSFSVEWIPDSTFGPKEESENGNFSSGQAKLEPWFWEKKVVVYWFFLF